ncbi:MAG: hypothetical protein ACOCUT_00800 [bacterium]
MEIDYKEKKCFIITPVGDKDSQIRRSTDGLISSVIRPLLQKEFNFSDIKAAHEINTSGSINNQIMKRIIYDELVLVNLTGLNPNVMYEVAVRHATLKPIIHICEEGTRLPFDIIDQRTIFYKNDMLGVQELKEQLKSMIKEALQVDQFKDNPIYNASQSKIFSETLSNNPEKNFEKYLLERFDKLESKISGNNYQAEGSKDLKFAEPFIIYIRTDCKVDKDYILGELKISLDKKQYTILLFKIDKQSHLNDYYETWINLIVISNDHMIPHVYELQEIFNNMKFTNILDIHIDGNELPF